MRQDIENKSVKKVLSRVGSPNDRLLEIGCGTGRMTERFRGRNDRVIALDINPQAVAAARAACPGAGCLAASGHSLPFADGSFDIVLFTQSLHHLDPKAALMEAKRVLRPRGVILVLEPVFGSELERICLLFEDERTSRLKALYELLVSGLAIGLREIFKTTWRFENRDELIDWLFRYYEKDSNEDLAEKVDQLLDDKVKSSPLDIEEKMLLISLTR